MKIEHRKVNDGILQITTSDERWYTDDEENFYKSNSWVTSFWPKGRGFEEWLKKNGDETEALLKDAGNKGSKVHQAIEDLLRGVEVEFDAKYMNHNLGKEEELTADEYWTLMTFVAWWNEFTKEHKVKVLAVEKSAINKEYGVGYTLDLLLDVDGEKIIIDHKTSPKIYMSHKLQTWFMKMSEKADKCYILQLGYNLNKAGYKLTEVEGELENEYKACLTIWEREVEKEKQLPPQKDYPMSLKVEVNNAN